MKKVKNLNYLNNDIFVYSLLFQPSEFLSWVVQRSNTNGDTIKTEHTVYLENLKIFTRKFCLNIPCKNCVRSYKNDINHQLSFASTTLSLSFVQESQDVAWESRSRQLIFLHLSLRRYRLDTHFCLDVHWNKFKSHTVRVRANTTVRLCDLCINIFFSIFENRVNNGFRQRRPWPVRIMYVCVGVWTETRISNFVRTQYDRTRQITVTEVVTIDREEG